MAAIKRLMVFVFSHFISSLGVRTLASGVVAKSGTEVDLAAGDVRPWLANHLNEGEFEFLILPLYANGDHANPLISVVNGEVEFSAELQAEVNYDLSTVNLHQRFWWVTDNDNLVVQLRGLAPYDGTLTALDSAKTAKRIKEYLRLTSMAEAGRPQILLMDHYEHVETDGRAAISINKACQMVLAAAAGRAVGEVRRDLIKIRSGEVTTMLLRVMGPMGTLKVEADIVPKLANGADLAFHASEWKKEVVYSKWFAHGELKAHTHGPAFMDVQTSSWMGEWMFPLDLQKAAVSAMFAKALAAIRRDEIPEWMISELEMDDDGEFHLGHSRDLQDQAKSYIKWQSHGLQIRQSGNLAYMAYQGLAQRAEKKDLFAPIPWATRAHVCTQTHLRELCGYDVDPAHTEKVYFDTRVNCLVFPTELFIKLTPFMGGWDQDGDSIVIALRRVKGTGRLVAVCWRNPNSPGEYAIVEADAASIPWEFTDLVLDGNVPEVDLESRPKFLDEVRENQTLLTLSQAPKGSGNWSHDAAVRELITQLANPGVGRVANALLVYSSCTSGDSPPWTYAMEDMVDTCMQTRYLPAFEQIEKWIEAMHGFIKSSGRIDNFLAGKCSIGGRPIKGRVPAEVMSGMAKYDGYFTKLHKHIKSEVESYRDEMQKESFRLRNAYTIGSLGDEASPFKVDDRPAANRGAKMVDWANEQFEAAARAFPRHLDHQDPMNKTHRSAANRAVVDKASDTLAAMSEQDRTNALIGAYRHCLFSTQHTFGVSDRILYAYGTPGKRSVMDMWIEVLIRTGDASTAALWGAAMEAEVKDLMKRVRESTTWVRPGDTN